MNFFSQNSTLKQWHAYFRLLAGIVLLAILGCDGCRPSASNAGFICTHDLPEGQTYTFKTSSSLFSSVMFRGRIYYPTMSPDCPGPTEATLHPLIIFGHGRYPDGVPTNYLGMTHLMNHLASWGYICISLDFDVVNDFQNGHNYGIPHRGELILNAIEYMASECRTPGSIFYERIDTNKIGLIGHSRGGSGAVYAANYNVSSGKNRPIKAIATISPGTLGTPPLNVPVPHISLYGSWDGDLRDGQGPMLWSQGTRSAPKQLVEIYGANHFFFTDNTTYFAEKTEISREAHKELAQGFINAWFDKHIRGYARYTWPEYLTGNRKIQPTVGTYISYLSDSYLVIDDGTPLGSPLMNNLRGENTPLSMALFSDFMQITPPDFNSGPALKMNWDANGDQLTFNIPVTDASAFGFVSFRVTQVHGNPLNVLNTEKDFQIRVYDNSGAEGTVKISSYFEPLQYPDSSGSQLQGSNYLYKQIMRSYRIPFTAFAGVNFTEITQIKFLFSQRNVAGMTNEKGAIKVEDLEFSN